MSDCPRCGNVLAIEENGRIKCSQCLLDREVLRYSNCCNARVHDEVDVCARCGEPCEVRLE